MFDRDDFVGAVCIVGLAAVLALIFAGLA